MLNTNYHQQQNQLYAIVPQHFTLNYTETNYELFQCEKTFEIAITKNLFNNKKENIALIFV